MEWVYGWVLGSSNLAIQNLSVAAAMFAISRFASSDAVRYVAFIAPFQQRWCSSAAAHSTDQQNAAHETELATTGLRVGSAISEIHPSTSTGIKKRTPAATALRIFFERKEAICHLVCLLKSRVSDDELQCALGSLSVSLDAYLVAQVLRCDLPCDVARRFFDWMKLQDGFKHNEYTYGVMMNNLGRSGCLDKMQSLFEEMKSIGCPVTSVTLSNVMLWYFKAQDMKGIVRHWNALRRSGVRPSAATYAVYIDYLVRTGQYNKIAIVFEEMLRVDCLPSSRTYTIFIEHLVQLGNLEAAHKILQYMKAMQVNPSRVTYKILINGFARANDSQMTLELLQDIREHFIRPNKRLMPAVRALEAAGKVEEARRLLQEIEPNGLPDDSNSQRCEENYLDDDDDGSDGDVECVMTVWRTAMCSNVGFDVNAFAHALNEWNPEVEGVLKEAHVQWERLLVYEILRRLRNLDSAWSFFHWLRDDVGFKHDIYSCVLLMKRVLKSMHGAEKKDVLVRELLEGMAKHAVKFTIPIFNLVIRHFVTLGEVEKALNIFKLAQQFKLEPNVVSYNLITLGFAKSRQGKKATELLREMDKKQIPLDGITCAELITCFGLAGKMERAYALFCNVSKPRKITCTHEYRAIMGNYSRVGDIGMALKIYEDMRLAGITPTQDMYEVVIEVLQKANRFSEVQAVSEERGQLNFFSGTKKVLQERLLDVLFLFMEGIKQNQSKKKIHQSCSRNTKVP